MEAEDQKIDTFVKLTPFPNFEHHILKFEWSCRAPLRPCPTRPSCAPRPGPDTHSCSSPGPPRLLLQICLLSTNPSPSRSRVYFRVCQLVYLCRSPFTEWAHNRQSPFAIRSEWLEYDQKLWTRILSHRYSLEYFNNF